MKRGVGTLWEVSSKLSWHVIFAFLLRGAMTPEEREEYMKQKRKEIAKKVQEKRLEQNKVHAMKYRIVYGIQVLYFDINDHSLFYNNRKKNVFCSSRHDVTILNVSKRY